MFASRALAERRRTPLDKPAVAPEQHTRSRIWCEERESNPNIRLHVTMQQADAPLHVADRIAHKPDRCKRLRQRRLSRSGRNRASVRHLTDGPKAQPEHNRSTMEAQRTCRPMCSRWLGNWPPFRPRRSRRSRGCSDERARNSVIPSADVRGGPGTPPVTRRECSPRSGLRQADRPRASSTPAASPASSA